MSEIIDGKLWHRTKVKVGSRASRRRGSKIKGGIRPYARIRLMYNEMRAERAAAIRDFGLS